jgi:hypothetical protein
VMNLVKKNNSVLIMLLAVVAGCLEPYQAPVQENPNYLVVDAFVDLGKGSANVNLSRSVTLVSKDVPVAETGARVFLEDQNGQRLLLPEQNGAYAASGLSLVSDRKYRLTITTSQNVEYASDYITLKNTPPITDLFYTLADDGLEIHLNTGDPTGKSHYYKWNYFETWEYTSKYEMVNKLVNGTVVALKGDELVYRCWKSIPPSRILVATTNRLQEDVVHDFPISMIPKGSIKLSKRYSILVQQQVLSEEGYNYWLNVQKTTEKLGGLFDPLPSQITGNIHCITNPDEQVIGFFDGASISEKRMFIVSGEVPSAYSNYRYPQCDPDTVLFKDPSSPTESSTRLIVFLTAPNSTATIGFIQASINCVDCRYFDGGVTKKPDFWP